MCRHLPFLPCRLGGGYIPSIRVEFLRLGYLEVIKGLFEYDERKDKDNSNENETLFLFFNTQYDTTHSKHVLIR